MLPYVGTSICLRILQNVIIFSFKIWHFQTLKFHLFISAKYFLYLFFFIYNNGRTLIKPFLFSFCLITVGSIKTTTIITMISTNINSNKIMVLLLFPILVIVKSNVRQTRNELVTKKQIGLLSQRHVRVT